MSIPQKSSYRDEPESLPAIFLGVPTVYKNIKSDNPSQCNSF
jgi:hypothetical protein